MVQETGFLMEKGKGLPWKKLQSKAGRRMWGSRKVAKENMMELRDCLVTCTVGGVSQFCQKVEKRSGIKYIEN